MFPNTVKINQELEKLRAETPAQFGIMTAQHMIEHLDLLLKISMEEIPMKLHFAEEKAAKLKAYVMTPGNEITIGFRAPILPVGENIALEHTSLDEAISKLKESIDRFSPFFDQNPDRTPVSPALGNLTAEEWKIFHDKHFRHHFKQFGLNY